MDIKLKNNNLKNKKWVICMVALAMFLGAIYLCIIPYLKKNTEQIYNSNVSSLETEDFIEKLYESNFVLYRDLYEKTKSVHTTYLDLYLQVSMKEELEKNPDLSPVPDSNEGTESVEDTNPNENSVEELLSTYFYEVDSIKHLFNQLDESFNTISTYVDYTIIDNVSGAKISNSSLDMSNSDNFHNYFSVTFDSFGMIENTVVRGTDSDNLLKRMVELGRNFQFKKNIEELLQVESGPSLILKTPVSCTISYGITEENIQTYIANNGDDNFNYEEYRYLSGFLLPLFTVIIMIFACLCPVGDPDLYKKGMFKLSLEALFLLSILTFGLMYQEIVTNSYAIIHDTFNGFFYDLGIKGSAEVILAYGVLYLFCVAYLMLTYYITLNIKEVFQIGIFKYVRKRFFIGRIFPYIKKKMKEFYLYITAFQLSDSSHKIIIRVVVINGILLSIICLFWFFGIFTIILYSILLYFILRKYVSELKDKYNILLDATNKMADGNLNVQIHKDLGVFEPFKPQIQKIQAGFKNAVEEEVKSQRMKTELITNVSHDLKTPLTAIITYIDLLKDENLSPAQRRDYLETLELKSNRLKLLIEDLFEVSKANSKNITLNLVDVELINLIKQTELELRDKFEASNLTLRLTTDCERIHLQLDSQKTYRIYENLLGNIAKYALPNTRVYVDITCEEEEVKVVIKNISAIELSVNPLELTERFVRGDASRTTEGSGLGLAIAKSFVELQNGRLIIELDGDLFKVTTIWKK